MGQSSVALPQERPKAPTPRRRATPTPPVHSSSAAARAAQPPPGGTLSDRLSWRTGVEPFRAGPGLVAKVGVRIREHRAARLSRIGRCIGIVPTDAQLQQQPGAPRHGEGFASRAQAQAACGRTLQRRRGGVEAAARPMRPFRHTTAEGSHWGATGSCAACRSGSAARSAAEGRQAQASVSRWGRACSSMQSARGSRLKQHKALPHRRCHDNALVNQRACSGVATAAADTVSWNSAAAAASRAQRRRPLLGRAARRARQGHAPPQYAKLLSGCRRLAIHL